MCLLDRYFPSASVLKLHLTLFMFAALFFCISYDYGFTHNLSRKTELRSLGASARKIPLVLLPEWPLPVDIFTPPTPTLALVANSYPRVPTTSSFDFQPKNWDPVETSSESTSPLKQLVSKCVVNFGNCVCVLLLCCTSIDLLSC